MGFSLGGLIKKGIGALVKSTPIGGAISTAFNILKPPAPKGGAGVLGNLPSIFTGTPKPPDGPGYTYVSTPGSGDGWTQVRTGGSVSSPYLPALSPGGGVVKGGPFSDVSGGSSSTAPGRALTARGHWKKDGSWSNRRRPRMNPMNVRAARKAVTRINAAEKLFRRILRVSSPEKASRRITPKRKR